MEYHSNCTVISHDWEATCAFQFRWAASLNILNARGEPQGYSQISRDLMFVSNISNFISFFSKKQHQRSGWRPWRSWLCPTVQRVDSEALCRHNLSDEEKFVADTGDLSLDTCHMSTRLEFQNRRLPLDDALPRPRCARAESCGRPDEMPCRSCRSVGFFCAEQNQPWLKWSPLHHGFMVLLTQIRQKSLLCCAFLAPNNYIWAIVLLTIDLSVSMEFRQSPGKPWFSRNIGLCKFSLKPIHCLKGSQVFRPSSLLSGESAAKSKHWDATGWALGN